MAFLHGNGSVTAILQAFPPCAFVPAQNRLRLAFVHWPFSLKADNRAYD